jgi:hypothetical protein
MKVPQGFFNFLIIAQNFVKRSLPAEYVSKRRTNFLVFFKQITFRKNLNRKYLLQAVVATTLPDRWIFMSDQQ